MLSLNRLWRDLNFWLLILFDLCYRKDSRDRISFGWISPFFEELTMNPVQIISQPLLTTSTTIRILLCAPCTAIAKTWIERTKDAEAHIKTKKLYPPCYYHLFCIAVVCGGSFGSFYRSCGWLRPNGDPGLGGTWRPTSWFSWGQLSSGGDKGWTKVRCTSAAWSG